MSAVESLLGLAGAMAVGWAAVRVVAELVDIAEDSLPRRKPSSDRDGGENRG